MKLLSQILTAAVLLSSAAAFAQDAPPAAPKVPKSFDLSALDTSVDPCTNFYQYACGNWRKSNPIPADQPEWGRFNELGEHNRYLLYTELKSAADSPKSALQKQYGDYFAACMNTDVINTLGDKPLQPTLAAILALNDKKAIAALISNPFHTSADFIEFGPEQDQKDSTKQIAAVSQSTLGLPDRDYYLQDDAHMKEIRAKYVAYISSMFQLLGDSEAQAAGEAQTVLALETELAKGSMPRVEMRDPDNVYHPMLTVDLEKLTPEFDWKAYFAGQHPPPFTTLNVAQPGFFKTLNQQLETRSLADWKVYLRFRAANGSATRLSANFDDLHFGFYGKTMRGQDQQQARWKRCTSVTDQALGEAVGQDWVKQNFPPEAKESMEKLVAALRQALAADIEQLPWMSPETKKQAEIKLDAFRQKIGYPEHWRDYSRVEVKPDEYYANTQRAEVFNNEYQLNHIGKPVDEKEWGMTPPTVNAYYDPPMNDINFPAGILQPPFYSYSIDPAVNFGSIGVVIGHEMTHGFDDEGSRYDAQGNVRDWWTKEDKAKFDERTDCEVKEYSSFEPVAGQHLNGKLTLGENTADNGGLRIAFQALQSVLAKEGPGAETKKIDGYTPAQRFFIGFAQVWCENTRPQYASMMVKVDPHSPGEFRTNGVVRNDEEFGKAFGCHTGQPMMPANICRVW